MTSLTKATVTAPPQLSLVMTPAGFVAGTRLAQVTVAAAGQETVGAARSLTVIL